MRHYFDQLAAGMAGHGFTGRTLITSSDGGVMGVALARDRALRTLVSGCASGVAGAATVAAAGGWANVLAIDMGGTSFDAAVIQGGRPAMTSTASVAGHEFLMPMLDLATIGAGGGSIAVVDAVGSLHVGPRSAGAEPGPVCYGRGGLEPTFTDAALVAGLLPETLLDGGMSLSRPAATDAIRARIAEPLGLDVDEAAAGILAVVEAKMGQLLEEMTVGQGLDPRDFTVFAYGGGGPLVAARLAEELGSTRVVIPPHPGVFSAWGMQTLDVVQEVSRTLIRDPQVLSAAELAEPFAELVEEAVTRLAADGFATADVTLLRFVEMRYQSQEHTLLVPFTGSGAEALRRAFDSAHQEAFGFTVPGAVEVVHYRLRGVGALPKPAPAGPTPARPADEEPVTRDVHDRRTRTTSPWRVLRRDQLVGGGRLAGPAIVEESTSTIVVPPGWTVTVDAAGNLVMNR
jgi:N-methylhydantoinase A